MDPITALGWVVVAGCWGRAARATPKGHPARRAATLAAVGATTAAIGTIIGTSWTWLRPNQPPPVWMSGVYPLYGPLLVAAALTWPAFRKPKDAWSYFVIDLAILVLGSALLIWFYQFGPSSHGGQPVAVIAQTAINVLLLIGLSVAIIRGSAPEVSLPFRLLVTSLAFMFMVNFALFVVPLPASWIGRILGPLTAAICLTWIGSAEALRQGWGTSRSAAPPTSASPIPFFAVSAIAILMLWVGLQKEPTGIGPIILGAIGMTILLLIRQSVTMRQNARLLAERAAHRADARIAALVRHTSDVILITDQEFKIRFISPSAEALWAGDPQRFMGADIRDLVDPMQLAEVDYTLHDRLMHPGQSLAARWRVAGADGTWRQVEAVISNLLYEPSVNGVVLTLRDYTERAQLEEKLHQAQKMEAVGQLAGGIAHDFNNLLTTILGHSEMGLETLEAKNPVREDLEQIKRASELAASLTKQLLAFSRKQIVEPRVIDVAASIDQIGRLLKRLIEENVRTILQVQPETGRVKMDPSQLEQVVLNLAINARDAMVHGGTLMISAHRERVRTELPGVISVQPGDYLVIEVSDTGVGMDQATQKRIFEPFFTTKPPGRGTGLGLASVYGIVTQNNGGLLLRSAPGQGSTFSVYLPRIEAVEAAPAAVAAPPVVGPASATILVVEDEPWLRDIAKKVLSKEGYQVLVAGDALEARALAHGTPRIDLLLTDVVMPGLSGPKLAAQLKRERPTLRVLFMSGYPGGDLTAEMAPNERLLRKPFAPHVMLEYVRAALEETRVG